MSETPCIGCSEPSVGDRCDACGCALRAGAFFVRRLISQSSHGRMYLVETTEGQRVALKEIAFALVPDAKTIDAFAREARLLKSIDLPAVPKFIASFQVGEGPNLRLYLAQEFVEGESLQARISRGPLDEVACRDIARQVLTVLDDLHRRAPRILHRDLKPANLIVREDGSVALVDFGAARELLREVTHGATFVGTFGYMPFEQMGGTVDERTDLYALGATLVHCLTGVPPADLLGTSLVSALEQRAKVSPPFRIFLARLLAPRRDDRVRSAAQALGLLEQRASLAANVPTFERLLQTNENRAQRLVFGALLASGAAIVVLLAKGLGIWSLLSPSRRSP